MVASSILELDPKKTSSEKKVNVKVALSLKGYFESSRTHSNEPLSDVILRCLQHTLPQFSFDKIKELAETNDFKIQTDEFGDVKVFRAIKGSIRIDCTQSSKESTVNVVVIKSIPKIDYTQYKALTKKFEKDPSVKIRFSGELNTVRILKHPNQYNLDHKSAFKKLTADKKKVGIGITFRFNNKKNSIKEIQSIL